MNILEMNDVTAVYGKVEALHNVSLVAPEGRVTIVLGPNGAGKTTLLRAVAGVARVTHGSIRFADKEVVDSSVEEMFEQGVLYQPETRELFPSMTIDQNLMSGVDRKDKTVHERYELVTTTFPFLRDRLHHTTGNLSGGEQQMVAIGRAFMANPRLLLLDEPSLGLAPAMVRTMFKRIQFLQEKASLTVLLAEQNTRMSLEIADDVYVLSHGAVINHREAASLSEEEVIRAYFGTTSSN